MKNLAFILFIYVILSSCSSSREAAAQREEERRIRKLAREAAISKAVESRKYVMRMDRLYLTGGRYLDLVPRSNYLIIDGDIVTVSLLYSGYTLGTRPISAIKFTGRAISYEKESNDARGVYDITMKVRKGNDNFDFYINIGAGGSCSFSLVNSYIQSVTYKGEIVPLPDTGTSRTVSPQRIHQVTEF